MAGTRGGEPVSGQLESQHFYMTGDLVQAPDGRLGRVIEASTLYARVDWSDESREVEQFDPQFVVIQRAEAS